MISKTAIHALKALIVLGQWPDEFQGTASIAERIDAPQNYLGKLLQGFVQSGLVRSQKGKGGGFQLARKPEEITLYEIIEPVDHVSKWDGCIMSNKECSPGAPCALHNKWAAVRDIYFAMLRGSTLADLSSKKVEFPVEH